MKAFTGRSLPLLVALGLSVAGCGGGAGGGGGSGGSDATATASVASPTAGSPTAQPTPTGPPAETPSVTDSSATGPPVTGTASPPRDSLVAGRYQPLWPFTGQEEADAWRRAYQKDGRQAWHLDAGRTAVAFARDHLGFTEIDQIVKTVREGRHARVHVGHRGEEGPEPLVAAVVHLVRYGAGQDAPWEVVGTDDTSLSLTTPRYGAAVGSPLTVGGRITGVDESIGIQVRRPGQAKPLGKRCCVSAGGQNAPWSATVTFTAEPGRTLTVVASTGGHVAAVERFAVTGVTIAGSPP
ncbi:hypothetical protein [Nonomuraea sp. NPDC002799]